MNRESVVVLLDVNGVLNPRMVAGRLQLDAGRAELVRQLAQVGRVVWATTWPPPFTAQLQAGVGMPGDTSAIDFSAQDDAEQPYAGQTGKLPRVARWLAEHAAMGDGPGGSGGPAGSTGGGDEAGGADRSAGSTGGGDGMGGADRSAGTTGGGDGKGGGGVQAVVWIDDHLGDDARQWAGGQRWPVLLVQPHAMEGLTAAQVEEIRRFVGERAGG